MTSGVVLAFGIRQDLLAPIGTGVLRGAAYGLVGIGLVLIYKGNRIFNFAQGEFGSIAALTTLVFIGEGGGSDKGLFGAPKLPYALAALLGLLAGTLTAVATERLVVRPLFRAPRVTLTVATVGVMLLLIQLEFLVFGASPFNMPPFAHPGAANDTTAFTLFGKETDPAATFIQWQELYILIALAVFGVLAFLFFRYSRYGLAILAVSQEPTAASVVGISVSRVSMLTWGIAGFLGSVAGITLASAPGTSFSPAFMTAGILIPAFTAAVFGGITSLPGVFIGGIIIGVIEQLAGRNIKAFPGADKVSIALALLLVLLFRPTGLLGKDV